MTNKSVWEDLFSPEEAPALRLRSVMLHRITDKVLSWGQNPELISQKLEISVERLRTMLAGHLDLFSYDDLVAMLPRAGLDLETVMREGVRRC